MYNRKHYEFVSSIIRSQRTHEALNNRVLDELAWKFSDAFKADAPEFDEDRFFNSTVDGVVKRPRTAKECLT